MAATLDERILKALSEETEISEKTIGLFLAISKPIDLLVFNKLMREKEVKKQELLELVGKDPYNWGISDVRRSLERLSTDLGNGGPLIKKCNVKGYYERAFGEELDDERYSTEYYGIKLYAGKRGMKNLSWDDIFV